MEVHFTTLFQSNSSSSKIPTSYHLIGSSFDIYANRKRMVKWTSDIVCSSPTSTFVLRRRQVFTANPSNVQHRLKTHFTIYEKGSLFRMTLPDLLGEGIFNTNGENWKFQRQVASQEFNTKSLRKFIEQVVDTEIKGRLVPILSAAAKNKTVLDFQDILQRFASDNICAIAFGYNPASLVPSLPQEKFMQSFEDAVRISSRRFGSIHPLLWKAKRLLDIGSEKQLRIAVNGVREFAKEMINQKKQELNENPSLESFDLLSRFLSSGHSDEDFVTDIVISFILAGRDSTSAALIWFF